MLFQFTIVLTWSQMLHVACATDKPVFKAKSQFKPKKKMTIHLDLFLSPLSLCLIPVNVVLVSSSILFQL